MECQPYNLNLPYPEVSGEADPDAVALLLEDYAGIISEMTASNQYMYQYFLLVENNYSFAEAIKCIAATETWHRELLGRAIVRLGGTPIFAATNTYWCSNYVSYDQDPQRMLLANINIEFATIYNYRWHIQLIPNESVKQLLERIILDEELHIRLFSEMQSALQ
ncbi:MAG TPA: hypothetical protein VN366_10985 [Feifaniaceae bacterium]|nr:hypothetical protein [Feifaniaceae bacterium]